MGNRKSTVHAKPTLEYYNIIKKRIAQKCSIHLLYNDCQVSYLSHIEALNLIQSHINRRTANLYLGQQRFI